MENTLKKPRVVLAVFKLNESGVKELYRLYRKEEDMNADINFYDGSNYYVEYSLLY